MTDTTAVPVGAELDLTDRSLYFNRELSWLTFNARVLQLAEDPRVALLERVKFCAIFSNNLDEFFMVRVAGLHDQIDAGIEAPLQDGRTPSETIAVIRSEVREQIGRQGRCLDHDLRPALAEHGISIVGCDQVGKSEAARLDERFRKQIFPVLTPLAVGLGRPFPYISNLSLSLGVVVRDPVGGHEAFARVKVPKEMLPRFVPVGDGRTFVPLEDLIAKNLDALFPGMEIVDHAIFRVTRDADFTVSDEADDLVRAVEDELRRRRFGEVVRVEVDSAMSTRCASRSRARWPRGGGRLRGARPARPHDMWDIVKGPGHADLRDRPWTPVTQPRLQPDEDEAPDLLAAMRKGDILLHHPYDSFATSVERFVEQAVADPDVLAIKQTVYRTSDDSPLVPPLIRAAERGKQAVCVVSSRRASTSGPTSVGRVRSSRPACTSSTACRHSRRTPSACSSGAARARASRHYVHVGTATTTHDGAAVHRLRPVDLRRGARCDVADMFNYLTGFARPRRTARCSSRRPICARASSPRSTHGRRPPRRRLGADPDEDELPRRPGVHRGPLPRVAGRSDGRAQHPRDLLPAPGRSRRVREHPGQLGRGTLPRALAHLRLRARRGLHGVHRLGRPDAAQPGHPGRAAGPGTRQRPAQRSGRHARTLPRGRHERLGARRGRQLDAADADPENPRDAQRELMRRHLALAPDAKQTA
jgi:polyphosphate kinase